MTTRDFAFWLQGFFEISNQEVKGLTQSQCKMIQEHLNLVFQHEFAPKIVQGSQPSSLTQGFAELDLSKITGAAIC